jgi:hypothetical protein
LDQPVKKEQAARRTGSNKEKEGRAKKTTPNNL